MTYSFFALRRLRVMQKGRAVYDEKFHDGVNIIRGENGSGKSTIADFIFYILGGEFDDWKDSAKYCDEVQAELETRDTFLTLRRAIAGKQEPVSIFFGTFEQAMASPLEGWHRLSIRRHGLDMSFSQVLFRYSGIPEAPSQRSSNITAHQILRLMYADQRTPAPRLFRFESFDTQEIRLAVSDLMVGVNGYELYDVQLALRTLKNEHSEKQRELDNLFKALPSKDGLIDTSRLLQEIEGLVLERQKIVEEIRNVDLRVKDDEAKHFIEERKKVAGNLRILSGKIEKLQDDLARQAAEVEEIEDFIGYLVELLTKLKSTSDMSSLLGQIEFAFCPSCLTPLREQADYHKCILCSEPISEEEERSKYASITYDTELQIRENKQLLSIKKAETSELRQKIREMNESYRAGVADYASRFDSGNSPRERYLAERNIRIGSIAADIKRVESLKEIAARIDKLNEERRDLGSEIDNLEARERSLRSVTSRRHLAVAETVSGIGAAILRKDLQRQEEFIKCKQMKLVYHDDAVLIDGKMNFAESSNVIAKNTAILSLFSASTIDKAMWHPRFVLFDNVEDKGMEEARSHRFQELIVERAKAAKLRHQIIFTTSMISPLLDNTDLCVGDKYSRKNRTLRL